MNKNECKRRLSFDIGLNEKAIEQSNKFSWDKMGEETIEVYKNLYSI